MVKNIAWFINSYLERDGCHVSMRKYTTMRYTANQGIWFLLGLFVLTAIGKRGFLTSTAPCSSGLLEF
jgi:hypothetical protein